MSALAQLPILDLSAELARLPLRPGRQVLPRRGVEQSITFHYSGVAYASRLREVEQPRIFDEARYQLRHNYGSAAAPAYPDGMLYDFVVLSDGTIVHTRSDRRALWHCHNALGNSTSWSTHVMLGPGQDLTDAQRRAVFALWDALRADGNIPRANVFSHCEWPVGPHAGGAIASTHYAPQTDQSACPGPLLHAHVVAYRAGAVEPPAATDLTFVAPHRISAAQFVRVLERAHSPAAPDAAALAEIPTTYGIDRAVALAFFGHESTYGKRGITKDFDTKNWGNVRRAYDHRAAEIITPPGRGPFAKFPTWQAGLDDWCKRMRYIYVDAWHLPTVPLALQRYAPSSDGNAPADYAAAVVDLVAQWQAEDAAPTHPNGPAAYRIRSDLTGRANARQGPGASFPIADTLAAGEGFTADAVVQGAPVSGDPRWVHLSSGIGFVHFSLVEEAA